MEQNPPGFLQARTDHDAALFRRVTQSWAVTPGVLLPPSNNYQVTATGPASMAVNVATGEALVTGPEGSYYCFNDATKSVTIAPSSGSSYRIDYIMLVVEDAAYSGTNSQWEIQAVMGTTNGRPSSVPTYAILLAEVTVPAGSSSIVSGNIADKRFPAQSRVGIRPLSSTSRPGAPWYGTTIFQSDTPSTRLATWTGTEWSPVANFHASAAHGPAGTNAGASPTLLGDPTVQYLIQAESIVVGADPRTATGGGGGYSINFPAPFPSGTLTVVAGVGDSSNITTGITTVVSDQVTKSSFGGVYQVGPHGGPYSDPGFSGWLTRINYVAIGW